MEKRYIPGEFDTGVSSAAREDSRKRQSEETPGLMPTTMTREDKKMFVEVLRDWLHEQRSSGADSKE